MSSAGDTFINRPVTAADYLAIFRRRKWIIIGLPLIAALTAYVLSASQSPVYQAKADVYFNLNNIPAALANLSPLAAFGDTPTYLATEARVARSPELAQRVVDAAGLPGESVGRFLGNSGANPQADTTILELTATAPNADDARVLVNTYAEEFKGFKAELDMKAIDEQLKKYQAKIDALGQSGGTVYETLIQKKLDLETLGGQLANNASVLQQAEGATKVHPRPVRNAILGGLLGGVLGLGLAFLAEALDRRVRSEEEVEAALGLPLLGRVPPPGRRLQKDDKLVMLADPRSVHAETFRKLRTSLEFVNLDRGARTIIVTSAGPREGKSTTVANLAVALARAGRKVALVDFDLRRPFLHSFFGVGGEYGITDVVVDRVELKQALRPITLPAGGGLRRDDRRNGRASASSDGSGSNGRSDAEGVLHLLPCGMVPPAADEFLERAGVTVVLEELSRQFEIVLVDAPPLLAVGDAMSLSTKVDAILVVTRLGIHRRQLQELARQLQNCRADVLGFILTGVSHGDSYTYGYGYDPHVYDVRREAERRGERV